MRKTWEHGTEGGYNNHGCRCDLCSEAKRVSRARWFENYLKTAEHGDRRTYKAGCRCKECTHAQLVADRARLYGISAEEYEAIYQQQDKACAVCRRTTEKLVVDHCHKTGVVRGLLCKECNTALGNLGDNLDGIMRAAVYLGYQPK